MRVLGPRVVLASLFIILAGVSSQCSNVCSFASDNDCDDGGAGSEFATCSHGTDCEDCGSRSGSGSSSSSSRGRQYQVSSLALYFPAIMVILILASAHKTRRTRLAHTARNQGLTSPSRVQAGMPPVAMAQPVAMAPAALSENVAQELLRLSAMYNSGQLTHQEFEMAKASLLGNNTCGSGMQMGGSCITTTTTTAYTGQPVVGQIVVDQPIQGQPVMAQAVPLGQYHA